ncbi:acyltransferase [Hyphomicrobium nitrativorans NL23]|uniref:Acyltransferase n=1 Tax=Hyphomicrobium nitrativorans NL23 TaxID=1029756 RepID=V5SE77_9HYPH|nr:acyltransferase family protein [Hyphomicrobium nitrativorans]AHB48350.1 acyltransferase [Hyphomicrobium nitrativorans NL23]
MRLEQPAVARLDWVDVAKGVCIILVVLMHATLGVEKATGESLSLTHFVEWARPFRMPDFFLISGLFLAARIDRPWRSYLDTKVVHFAYFYVLWLTIQFALKAPGMVAEHGAVATLEHYVMSFFVPFSTLWFIYLLAAFFVVSKLLRPAPHWLVLGGAALLHAASPHSGVFIVDEFTSRFVFFYSGYALAPMVFAFADRMRVTRSALLLTGLAAWAAFNTVGVVSGIAFVAGADLLFSYVGIAAVIAFSVLVTTSWFGRALAYCGEHSIAVYLAFTVFMGPARIVLLKLTGGEHATAIALASTFAGIAGALLLAWLVKGTWAGFLFARPQRFRLASPRGASGSCVPASA